MDLVRPRSAWLFGIALHILRDVDRAEDALQDALVIAWRDLRGLRDPERFDPWLRRVLVNVLHPRGDARAPPSGEFSGAAGRRAGGPRRPAEPRRPGPARTRVPSAAARSPVSVSSSTTSWATPRPRFAETLGIPPGTARSRLFNAHRAMRAALEAEARLTTVGGRSASSDRDIENASSIDWFTERPTLAVRSRPRRGRRPDRSAAAAARVAPPVLEGLPREHVRQAVARCRGDRCRRGGRLRRPAAVFRRLRRPKRDRITTADAEPFGLAGSGHRMRGRPSRLCRPPGGGHPPIAANSSQAFSYETTSPNLGAWLNVVDIPAHLQDRPDATRMTRMS